MPVHYLLLNESMVRFDPMKKQTQSDQKRETRPYVGFIPTIPLKEAGCRIEPPVSLPNETGTQHATAAAEPLLKKFARNFGMIPRILCF